MRSSFAGLENTKRSIQISQKSLDIASNNLTNATTPGYTRQRVDQYSMYLSTSGLWQTKTAKLTLSAQGVNAFGVSQIRDPYLDKRYRDISCYEAEYNKRSAILSEVETTLDNIENIGIAKMFDDFKTALSTYATNAPDNKELASIVRNQAYNITTTLNAYATDLSRLLENNVFEMETSVENVNTLIEKITDYNKAILGEYKATEFGDIDAGEAVSPYGPLELMDARNLLIDELSYYADIHVTNNPNGTVSISMAGQTVVDQNKHENIVMKDYDSYGAAVLRLTGGEELRLASGELKAYQDLVSGNGPYASYFQNSDYGIPYYMTAINILAQDFANLMNTFNGCTEKNTTRAMFGSSLDVYDDRGNVQSRGVINASTIRISDEWMNDATMIGEVYNPETGAWAYAADLDGNHANELLLAMSHEFDVGYANDFYGNVYDYVLFISNRLGQNISYSATLFETATTTANALLDSRDAIAGVSDTEEGINMLTYQKWFNASSRMMTTMDECLDRVINNMGRVGL